MKTENAKGAFSPKVLNYISEVQFPRLLANTKVKYIATIKSTDAMKEIATQVWQYELKDKDEEKEKIVMNDFLREEDARQWLNAIL